MSKYQATNDLKGSLEAKDLTNTWMEFVYLSNPLTFLTDTQMQWSCSDFDKMLENADKEDIVAVIAFVFSSKARAFKWMYTKDILYNWNKILQAMDLEGQNKEYQKSSGANAVPNAKETKDKYDAISDQKYLTFEEFYQTLSKDEQSYVNNLDQLKLITKQ